MGNRAYDAAVRRYVWGSVRIFGINNAVQGTNLVSSVFLCQWLELLRRLHHAVHPDDQERGATVVSARLTSRLSGSGKIGSKKRAVEFLASLWLFIWLFLWGGAAGITP